MSNKRKAGGIKMKKAFAVLALAAIILGTSTIHFKEVQAVAVASDITSGKENLIKNGSFDSGIDGWGSFTCEGAEGSVNVVNGKLEATVKKGGDVSYGLQVYNEGFTLYKGGKYVLKFDISASVNRPVDYRIQLNEGDYRGYIDERITVGPSKQTITASFTMNDETDRLPRLAFNLGQIGDQTLNAHTVTIDEVALYLVDDSNIQVSEEAPATEAGIVLSQLGYLTNDAKRVVLRGEHTDKTFNVVSVDTGKVIYTGQISSGNYHAGSKETTYTGDFSSVKEAGTYKITTESLGESYPFKIGKDVYQDVLKDAVRMFYLQRCGEVLPQTYAGNLYHDVCHTSMATIYGTTEKIDVSGGWHDAGDYGRYVVATSKTLGDLMSAYAANPTIFDDATNIPESGNGVPDVLDEIKGQLKWLFKMQNQNNGGVYHKVTCANFPGYVMPEQEKAELIVSPITATATGDFAAVMAMGYETFKTIDSEFANKCLAAGEKAWDYLVKAPSVPVVNPPGIVTGEYGDKSDTDERYWAAAALFKATGKSKYNDAFKNLANQGIQLGYDWSYVGNFGNEAYLAASGADASICEKIKEALTKDASHLLSLSKADAYGITNGTTFYWGSNMAVLNEAIEMDLVGKLTNNVDYRGYAKEHVNYCFGKNPLALSFVTGYGTVTPQKPHHRPSMIRGVAPGMIVGGVNSQLEDSYAKTYLANVAPAKCYLDHAESYSTNEVDIYWNSTLVHALAKLDLVAESASTGGGEGNTPGGNEGNTPGNGESDNENQNPDDNTGETTDNSGVEVQIKNQISGNTINQVYTVSAKGDQSVDVSKVAIRYYFTKADTKEMKFWCDSSSAQLNVSPWYVDLTSGTKGVFGSDSNGRYIELTFSKQLELKQGQGSLNAQVRLTNSDWSNIQKFEEQGYVIYYNGAIVER